MGVNPVAFESGGQRSEHVIPGAYSRTTFVEGFGGGLAAGNAVILGVSAGGEPNKLMVFSSSGQAAETLRGGSLLEAVRHAFNPGPDHTPQRIAAWRINPGTQATRELQSGAETMIDVTSWDWGVHTNQLKLKIENGTSSGKKISVQFQSQDPSVRDNVEREVFSIQYTGAGTAAVLNITKTGLATTVTGGPGGEDLDIMFESFDTVESLVSYLNDQAAYSASILVADPQMPSSELDSVSSQDIESASYTAKADLQAIIDALNGISWIGEATYDDAATTRTVPDNDADYVYFTGAVHGATSPSEWEAALALLEHENVQIVGADTHTEAIHVLIADHCKRMNGVEGKKERMFLLGGQLGETVAQATARAAVLNTENGSLAYPGITTYDVAGSGKVRTYGPVAYAAKLIGMESSVAINEPLTNKTVGVLAWEKKMTKPEIESLIKGGVMAGGISDDGRFVTMRALTTFQGAMLQKNERSMMREALYMARDLRTAIQGGVGRPGVSGSSGDVESTFWAKVAEWFNLGLIVKGDQPNLAWGLVVDEVGDAIYVRYHTYLTAPRNFFFLNPNQNVYSSLSVAV